MSEQLDRVLFLGSASGQTGGLEPVSFVIDTTVKILVETGPSVVGQLDRAGLRPKDLESVFVTHAHADHSLGFPYLAFAKHIDRIENGDEGADLSVYCSREVWSGLRASTAFHYPPGEFPTFGFRFHDIENPPNGSSGGIEFEAIPVKHTVPAFAFRFTTPRGKTVVYSSDTIYDERIVEKALGVDLLIHEAMLPSDSEAVSRKLFHSTINDASRVAAEAQPLKLAVCHMIPPLFDAEDEVVSEIEKSYTGEVIFPREGTEILL